MGLEAVIGLSTMPVVKESTALWEINLNLKSTSPFVRIASTNHPIAV
jgi:hypothetical protein